jgi:hypothetical protein
VGRRRRAAIRDWADALVAEHGAAVARVIGLDPPLPEVRIHVTPRPGVASTNGLRITLHEPWFAVHPDDAGCVAHSCRTRTCVRPSTRHARPG